MKRVMTMVLLGVGLLLITASAGAELVARYTFDDGTVADSSGNANDGVIVGGVTSVDDVERGKVISFDGVTGSYIRVPNSDSLNAVAGQITIAMWLNTPNTGTRQLIEKGGTGGSAWYVTPWGIRMESDRTLRLNWGNNQAPEVALLSSAVPLSTWTHVAMTYDSTLTSNQRKFYINGVLDTQSNWTGGATPNTNDLFIGTDWYNATSRWAWIGLMDDLQIFDTALTEGEIGQVMTGSGVTNINPKNGAIRVLRSEILSWEPPAETEPNFVITGYDLYFDPNETFVTEGLDSVQVALAQTEMTYDPFGSDPVTGLMAFDTTYFWRVDIVGQFDYATEPNIITGPIFNFTTVSPVPEILTQPADQVRGPLNGKLDAEFTVTAIPATGYQWYKNDVAIQGATGATLTIANVQESDEAQYHCVVTNLSESIASDKAWLEFARQTSQWAFDNDYSDSIGGHDGSVADANSTPNFAAGKIGDAALSLDGVDDYLVLPVAALPKAGTEMTFAFWAQNNTPTAGTVTMYAFADAAPGNRLVNIHTPWSNNNAYLDISSIDAGTSYDRVAAGNAVVTTGEPYWIYWVFTKDIETGVQRVYRDGVQIGQATGLTRRQYGADQLYLGANRNADNVLGQFFNGMIDDLKIYNYALDEVDAAYLYYDAVGEKVCINATDPILVQYDFNSNCKIDLGDFAELAANWLVCQRVPDCVERP